MQLKRVNTIDIRKYEKLELSADFQQKVHAYLKKRMPTAYPSAKKNGFFQDYLPLQWFCVDDGKVYVQTYKQVGEKSEFYIFNTGGKLLGKTMVLYLESEFMLGYPFAIAEGKIYQVVENPDTEEWELHVNTIWPKK